MRKICKNCKHWEAVIDCATGPLSVGTCLCEKWVFLSKTLQFPRSSYSFSYLYDTTFQAFMEKRIINELFP